MRLGNRTGLSRCAHSEGQGPTELVWSLLRLRKKYNKKYFCLLDNVGWSKVVVVGSSSSSIGTDL